MKGSRLQNPYNPYYLLYALNLLCGHVYSFWKNDRKVSVKNWVINHDCTDCKVIAILNLLKCSTFYATLF